MEALDKMAWQILNATADDCENLEQIYRQICYELVPDDRGDPNLPAYFYRPVKGAPFLSELADRIRDLVDRGLLIAEMDEDGRPIQIGGELSYVWRAWFRMTPQGKTAWESSPYFVQQEQSL